MHFLSSIQDHLLKGMQFCSSRGNEAEKYDRFLVLDVVALASSEVYLYEPSFFLTHSKIKVSIKCVHLFRGTFAICSLKNSTAHVLCFVCG